MQSRNTKNKFDLTKTRSHTYPSNSQSSSNKPRKSLTKYFSTSQMTKRIKQGKQKSIVLEEENWSSAESESDSCSDIEENSTDTKHNQDKSINNCNENIIDNNEVDVKTEDNLSEKTISTTAINSISTTDIDVQTSVSTDEHAWSDAEKDDQESLDDEAKTELADYSFFSAKSSSNTSLPNLSRHNSSHLTESKDSPRGKVENEYKEDTKSLMRRQRLQPIGQKVRDLKLMQEPKEEQSIPKKLSISGKTFFTKKSKSALKEEQVKKVKIAKNQKKLYSHKKAKIKNQFGSEKYIDKKSLSIITRPGKK